MSAALQEMVDKVIDGRSFYHPVWRRVGNFTVCILFRDMDIAAVDVAKCNPRYDEFDAARGERIALARAIKQIMNGA